MKKLLVAALLAVSLVGCTTANNLFTGLELVTASVANPVTPAREAQIEQAIDTAVAVLNGYRTACIQGKADKNCRANIQAVQVYTRQMGPLLQQLRSFVDNNQTVNANVVYNQLLALYTNFKAAAAGAGLNVGNLP